MRAQAFDIASRHRKHPNKVPSPSDFELVAAGDVDASSILDDPTCSLYCLDRKGGRALFVQTPRGSDLHQEAFLYQAQHREATRVFALDNAAFIQAAQERGGPRENVVFVYSVGRCGSTLLSRAFHRFDSITSLSEPDAPIQLLDADTDPAAALLLQSAVRLLCKDDGRKQAAHYVIKFRAEGTKLIRALHQQFPASRAMFLYRNGPDVVRSFIRAFHPLPAAVAGYQEDPVAFFVRYWQASMEDYLAAYNQGVPMQAFRYEDLVDDPRAVFGEIARWCGTPLEGLDAACSAFAEDSQEGSNLARQSVDAKDGFDLGSREQLAARVAAVLANHPLLHNPDVTLPGTWLPGQPPAFNK